MPLFEYRCSNCKKRFSQLVGMTADSREPKCPHCGGLEVTKLVSHFSRLRGIDDKLDNLEDTALSADLDNPKAASKMLREMGKEIADEDGGEDFEQYIDEAEKELYDGGEEEDA